MEMLIIQSKLKKQVKEWGLNTSNDFFEHANIDLINIINAAINHAREAGRRTVMAKDFDNWKASNFLTQNLVVTAKVKKYIKEQSGMSTSEKCLELLSLRLLKTVNNSIDRATLAKRKTIMAKDCNATNGYHEAA